MSAAQGPERGSSLTGEEVLILLGGRREAVQRPAGAVRYELDMEVSKSPWLGFADYAVRRLHPSAQVDEASVLVGALCKAFADTTTSSYVGFVREFAEFCDMHDPELDCLPATAESVHLFLAHKALSQKTGASSLPGMVSAINAVHNLCGLQPPIKEDAHHRLLMAGFGRIIQDTKVTVPRGPFLPSYVVPLIEGAASASDAELGDVVCVFLGLLLGLRGSALAGLLAEDVLLSEPGAIRVRATVLKRALQPRAFADWVIRFDKGDGLWGQVVSLVARYKATVQFISEARAQPLRLFSKLPGSGEGLVDQAIIRVLGRLPSIPAEVKATLTSHSLRIGACSCMAAIGVPREVIRLWFKWQSSVMIDTYCRVVQPEHWMEKLFGWMKRPGAPIAMFD